ncbi:MAG TPA: chromosome segregation protein SMC, partial [Candidatus Polarisedimenticolia bacterium]|nr:chromosome segregation protein SMC [Candidatus Polarisedimenticolia bacterium]
MPRLEKLELIGFKSFLSRTEFLFDKPITAVVGPNGCGKSNIGDALNWVIGEQSVKSLRGDRMEDVIFNGSEGRKPLGMAEVSLHLREGEGPGGESLVITRRLFRSGESEYLLDGQRCRLRDVQEKLAQINVGSGLYAIIEQGKVDAALSSKPRDRRLLIEEAAGIALYKARKRQAEAKLEATEANLLRVNDIVVEVEKQIGSLKRQAARARRYGRLMEELRRQERIVLRHEHARLEAERGAVEQREDAARSAEAEAAALLGRIESAHEEDRRRLSEREGAWLRQRDELHAAEREMDRLDHDAAAARQAAAEAESGAESSRAQAAALSARLEELGRQVESRRAGRQEQEQQVGSAEAQRERLEEARCAVEERIASLEKDLAGGRAAFLQIVDALSDARNRRRQIEEVRQKQGRQGGELEREQAIAVEEAARCAEACASREAALTEAERAVQNLAASLAASRSEAARLDEAVSREGARRDEAARRLHGQRERLRALEEVASAAGGARELLGGLARIEGLLSDVLRAPAHLEPAVETYLGVLLDAALVPGRQEALAGIAALKRSGRGRAGFLPCDGLEGALPPAELPGEVLSDPGFAGRMAEQVHLEGASGSALAGALSRAVIAADLDAAMRMRRHAPAYDYVTPEGDILHASGLIEGGTRSPEGAGVLSRRRLQSDLSSAIEAGASHLESVTTLCAGLESGRETAGGRAAEAAALLAEKEKEVVALRLNAQSAREESARAAARLETLALERRAMDEEAAALVLEWERLALSQRDLEEARRQKEASMSSAQEEIADLRAASARTGESLAVVRASLSAARQRLDALDSELARLLEADQELRDRIAADSARAADLDERRVSALQRAQESARLSQELAGRCQALDAAVKEGELELVELRLGSESASQQVKQARTGLEDRRAVREAVTLEKERVAADLRHLLAGLPAGSTLEEHLAGLTEEDLAPGEEASRASLESLRQRRDQMGPVNMMALDQFRELEERHQFLSAQGQDLREAMASLKDTISRINRTSRERFLHAFETIRAEFVGIHATLFGGGRADLRLLTGEGEGEEDVLECGLEIIAQPPGKRLQSVSLLSGGEKALTAIALLFAIFRFRPSPFCLLDEVDAPLDEANVLRFNELLKSMAATTQFVLITHNRRSMEEADVLYGITMEEAGVSRAMSVVLDGAAQKEEAVRSLPAMLAARHRGGLRPASASAP